MARAGDVLASPATGDRLVFGRTAGDSDGEVLEYEITFVPRGFATQNHLHPAQQERHEVLEGTLGIVVDGRERRLGPGDVEIVPPGTAHRLFAVGDDRVRVRFESRPALRSEELLETLFALAREGKVNREGMPGALQLAMIGQEFAAEGYPASPPRPVQRVLLAPLAALGRARGYRGVHAYAGADG